MNRQGLGELFPENRVFTDGRGGESVAVWIEKFYLDEVIEGASHRVHPAFFVNGRELDGIWVSKFQNVVEGGRAYSRPDEDPATEVDFDAAVGACLEAGEGFHLMTAAEWGAIALWCRKNHCMPRGNNDLGKDVREDAVTARISYRDGEKSICRVATGTGPITWSHNGRCDGIYDLNANVWEWMGGMRLCRGELQMLPDNNGASGAFSQSSDSPDWRALDGESGEWIVPNGKGTTEKSVKLDMIDGRWTWITGELTSSLSKARFCDFADVCADLSVCDRARELLMAIGCLPVLPDPDGVYSGVSFYANNGADERLCFCGGRWGQGINAGLFKTCIDDPRSYSGAAVGFRSVYCEL